MGAPVRLNPLDSAWILTESRATPNHVGGLLTFRLPEGASRDYLRQMMHEFRSYRSFVPPWNHRLKVPFNKNPLPAWIEDDKIDLEYHVRHAALPWPGGERELGELVGRLQSTPIDLQRPPWECTIIEGLSDDRFAIFIKMHHSLIDGVSGMKMLERSMSPDREKSQDLPPFWSHGPERRERGERRGREPARGALPTMANVLDTALEGLTLQARTLPQLVTAFGKIIRRIGDKGAGMVVPFDAPRSMLNGRVREKRRFATQQFALPRLRALAAAGNGTLNDVVLAVCGGALRRFLLERDALPEKSLTAGIPVSVRPKDDEGTGNAISFIVATLGTDIADPVERLDTIKASVRYAKEHLQSLPRQAMTQYTMLLMAPTILTLLTGIGGRMRPMFNITVSNVPGPDKPLYFRGAELLAIYPASIVTHGQAMNITCESLAGQMNFGFTACHTSVPGIQKLAVHTAEAVQELEAALLPKAEAKPQPEPKAVPRKRAPRPAEPAVPRGELSRPAEPDLRKRAAPAAPRKAPAARKRSVAAA